MVIMETIREIKNSVETSIEIRHREQSSKRSVTGTAQKDRKEWWRMCPKMTQVGGNIDGC
jgi:hypothetical protein